MGVTRWRSILGWEGIYSVSSDGHIRNERSQLILKDFRAGAGYRAVCLSRPGHRQQRTVHRIVALAFCEIGEGTEVNHLNGDKSDNRAENLEWTSRSGNEIHSRHVLGHSCKPIVATHLESGVVIRFNSYAAATHQLGLHDSAVRKCLRGMIRQSGGWSFSAVPTMGEGNGR